MPAARPLKITMGFTAPEVTARVVAMIARMRVLSRSDPELALVLAELSIHLPSDASGEPAKLKPFAIP